MCFLGRVTAVTIKHTRRKINTAGAAGFAGLLNIMVYNFS